MLSTAAESTPPDLFARLRIIANDDSPAVRTPNLDRPFRQGTEFQQFHVNSSVRSPSRAALYMGQFPGRNKVFHIFGAKAADNRKLGMNDWLDPQVTMLPRLMRGAGYVTGHYGKWHLTNSYAKGHAPKLSEYGIDDGRCWNGPDPATWGHDTVYKETMDFIRKHKDVPFFMSLWIRETHTPHRIHDQTLHLPWIEELPEELRVYVAVAWEADQWIGQILDLLRGLELEKNTIVVFTSDNGPEHVGADTAYNRAIGPSWRWSKATGVW